jgi:hypothetical protein
VLERRDHAGAEHVRDAAQEPLAAAAHQDAVVVLGELQARRLEHGDVMAGLRVEALEQGRLRLIEVRELVLREPVASGRVEQELLVHVAIPESLRQRHADLRAARSHLMRDNDDGHGSPPPVLVFERGRSDRDALAGDVVQDVDLVRERAAGEDLEDFERGFQRRVWAPVHQLFDRGALESLH